MRLAHEFLQNFCAGNQQNQALLHKHINLFLNPGVRLEACLGLCAGRRTAEGASGKRGGPRGVQAGREEDRGGCKREERGAACSLAVMAAGTCYDATFIPTGNILIGSQEDVNTLWEKR